METPSKCDINGLLTRQLKLVVPKYQRAYDWKDNQQVKDLLDDINNCSDSINNKNLFLGTMIFDISRKETKEEIEIIDGQQRITTILVNSYSVQRICKKNSER